MTDRKSDVDITKLLHQLEELKKKKAQNVKKLKRKLGRAVLLNKPESVHVSPNCKSNSTGEEALFLKLHTQVTKNISSKLNGKNSNFSKIKLADEEQENFHEGNLTFYNAEAESCSSLQPNKLKDELYIDPKLISQSVSEISKNSTLETEATLKLECKTLDKPKSANPESCVQGEEFRYCGKRSSDTEKEDIFDSQSNLKRIKLCNDELALQNKKISNLESDSNKIFDLFHANVDVKIDSEICEEIMPNSIKTITLGNEFISQKTSKKHSDIQKDITVLTKLNNESHTSLINEERAAAENLSDNCQSLGTISGTERDHVHSSSKQSVATLNNETKVVLNSSQQLDMLESSSSLCCLKQTTCETNAEVEIDPNVTEVADTEIGFDKQLQINDFDIQERFLDINSKISDTIDAVELPLHVPNFKEMYLTDSAYKNEDICLLNIQSNVANIEEIRTEIPQTDVIEPTLHLDDNKDSIKCDFTDDESDHSKCFDSNDLEALCQSDYDKDPENSDNEYKQNSPICEDDSCSIVSSKILVKDNQITDCNNDQLINIPNSQHLVADSDVFVVPETELFDFASYNESEADYIGHNICIVDTDNNENKRKLEHVKMDYLDGDSYSLNSEINKHTNKRAIDETRKNLNTCNEIDVQFDATKQQHIDLSFNKVIGDDVDTDSLGTEDFLKLVNYKNMSSQPDLHKEISLPDKQSSCLNFKCSLRSDINELVSRLKLTYFNNSQYVFIQHITWIQVWRQEKDHDWIKIFAHQVEGFELQDICLSQSENYLVLVMLLKSEENNYCLHFLVFERESRLIKLMEHTHWFENKSEEVENIFLCGLDDLKFASAQGSLTFKVYSHTFSCLDGNPRMLTVALGSSNDCLHSLCRIDKLPNALLGMSNNMLYIWHVLEARLVTSVCLQVDSFDIESCIWTIVENGLIFLMVVSKENENSGACQLLTANLATGFCEVALTYTLQPALEVRLPLNRKLISYSEPLIGMTCENGAFIWSVEEEYCFAFLNGSNYRSIAVVPTFSNSFLIVVGCDEGCVNCYELKS